MVCNVVSVEDDPHIAELIRVVLHSPGIKVFTTDDADEALAMVRDIKPDLVMMDIMMPGEQNGWDIYDAIRCDPELAAIPVIMLSVMREEPERRQAFARSEIDLYMTKPFDTLRLRRAVERMTGYTDLWEPPQPEVAKSFSVATNRDSNLDFLPPKPTTEELRPVAELKDDLESPDAVLDVIRQVGEVVDANTADADASGGAIDTDKPELP